MDAVYDRAALVAVAPDRRQDYADLLGAITGYAPQLLIGFDYDQATMQGPPFSIPGRMIKDLYSARFEIEMLENTPVTGRMAERVDAQEEIWLLTPSA